MSTNLVPPTRDTMKPSSMTDPLGPRVGPHSAGPPTTLIRAVSLLTARLTGPPLKNARVVVPTLHVPSLKNIRPTHTATTLPPAQPCLSPMVATYLPSPIPITLNPPPTDLSGQRAPVSRRATASFFFRSELFLRRAPKTICLRSPKLTLERRRK